MSERTYHEMRIYNHTSESTINQLTYTCIRILISHLHQDSCSIELASKHVDVTYITHRNKHTHVGHQNLYRDRLARCTLAPTRPHIRDRHF